MEIKNLATAEIKKIWETPAVVEINKSEILGAGALAADGGAGQIT